MQNVKFSEKFLLDASQFGLHLDATPGAILVCSAAEITVSAVLDLENVAVLIDNRANNVVLVDFAAQKKRFMVLVHVQYGGRISRQDQNPARITCR
jgi:hypothetical protein